MKTLICIAGMPFAERTVLFASLIARITASQVTLLNVIGSADEKTKADELLSEARMVLDVPLADMKIRQGSVVTEIVEESREGDYDLIVVGASVAEGLLDLLFKSTTSQVTRHAPSSVLVVKNGPPSLRRILVCTGGRQVSRSVVKMGGRLAQAANAELKLLYVADAMPAMYTGLETMEETLQELLQSNTPIARHLRWAAEILSGYEVSAELILHRGIAVDEILEEAHSSASDLIVIGAQVDKTSWLDDLLMSTVTPQVVERAPCSVLVVRSKHEGAK